MHQVTFRELFKKYRLRSEFDSLSELADALVARGIVYDESIYSHWQRGSRVPNQRFLVVKLLEIFVEREGIRSLDEANGFLASAGMGYLTKGEMERISL